MIRNITLPTIAVLLLVMLIPHQQVHANSNYYVNGTLTIPINGIQYGHLIVKVKVNNTSPYGSQYTENDTASDFNMNITGNNQSPDSFKGNTTGTNVTLGFGSYQVVEGELYGKDSHNEPYTLYNENPSQDCTGVIHPNETKTCIYYNQNDYGPFS